MKRIAISFSGGRSSAVMTKLVLAKYRAAHEIVVTFANTGCEHEATLEFIRNCDLHFGFGTVWMEAITGPPGVGVRPKIVDFETASRNGEPFEAYIAKHGIPNRELPQCTSRLKTEVMEHYIRHVLGWKVGTYDTAIGIRADEIDRVSKRREEKRFIYPLADAGYTKARVKAECAKWPFDLELSGEHYGNCIWCWKKSFRKLMTLAVEAPQVFDFPRRMEREYGSLKADNRGELRRFFRGDQSVDDIFAMAQKPFVKYADAPDSRQRELFEWDEELDVGSGCGETCEIGADD